MEIKWTEMLKDINFYNNLEQVLLDNGLESKLVDEFMDIAVELTPEDLLDGINDDTPFSEALNDILKNLSRQENILIPSALLENMRILISLTQVKEAQQRFESIPHNSMAFAIMTLIEVMAASSKMGLGTEDSVCIVDGARDFANQLLSDPEFGKMSFQLIRSYSFVYKKDMDNKMRALLPFNFATGVLIDQAVRDQFIEKIKSKQPLAKNLSEFEEIQTAKFGNCLTEATRQAADFYKDFLKNSTTFENFPFLFEDNLPPNLAEAAEQMNSRCKKAMNIKMESAPRADSSQSYNWFRSASPLLSSSDEDSPMKNRGPSTGK